MKKLNETTQRFLKETRYLISELGNNPQAYRSILRFLSMTKDNPRMLGFMPMYKLYKALEDVYKALCHIFTHVIVYPSTR